MQHTTIAVLLGITFAILIVFGVAGIRRNRPSEGDADESPASETEEKKGMSAFEIAQATGFIGTQEEWLKSITPPRKYSSDEVAYIFGKDSQKETVEKLLEVFKGPSDPRVKTLAYRHWKGSDVGAFIPSILAENFPGFIRLEDEFINGKHAIGFIVLGSDDYEAETKFGLNLSSSFNGLSGWDHGPFRKLYSVILFTGNRGFSESKFVGSMVYVVKTDIVITFNDEYKNKGRYPGVDNTGEISWCRNEVHDLALAFNENIHGDHIAALERHQEQLANYALLQSRHVEMTRRHAKRIKMQRSKAIMNNSRGFPIARHLL